MELEIRFIQKDELHIIMPLLELLNDYTDVVILRKRVEEMATYPNYDCIGCFHNDQLIGMSGLWTMTRHYCGKSLEPDHVIVHPEYRSNGIGKLMMDWVVNWALENQYEACELNAYLNNTGAHKFYHNEDFKILGFHYLKKLD